MCFPDLLHFLIQQDKILLVFRFYLGLLHCFYHFHCFQQLTNLYESNKEPENAIANIEETHKKHERNALHYQIGKVCADYNIQLDKGEKCLAIFIKNHSSKDGVPIEWAYYRMAQIQKHRNNKNDALKWIDKALTIKADFKQALSEKEVILSL